MSDGLNREFRSAMRGEFGGIAGPLAYLRSHIFDENTDAHLAQVMMPGFRVVNLVPNGNRISLRLAGGNRSEHSHAFQIHWLPYAPGVSHTMPLSNIANYLFTPSLTGCIFEIDGTTVTHHGAGQNPWPPPALANLPRGGSARRRIWDNGGHRACIVIGVRRHNSWSFYQQSYGLNHAGRLPASQVSAI